MVNFPYCIKNAIKYKKSEMRKKRERERERGSEWRRMIRNDVNINDNL